MIRPVIAYWVDGDVLHYVTPDKVQRAAPLGEVDCGLSERLNRERRVPFRMPS